METGWLIERGQVCVGVACRYRLAWVAFTDENAIRFARKQDAEAMLKALGGDLGHCTVSEHSWG